MAKILDADVLAYEYPGYSLADGSPSEAGCYAAAMAAHAWALRPADEGGGGASPKGTKPIKALRKAKKEAKKEKKATKVRFARDLIQDCRTPTHELIASPSLEV